MKRKIRAVCLLLLLILLLLFLLFEGCKAFQQFTTEGWERMLAGPYLGLPFAGEIHDNPISTITLSQNVFLEAHQVMGGDNGDKVAILLRTQSQSPAWMRILAVQAVYENDTNEVKQIYLRKVTFKRVAHLGQQYKVFMTCDVGGDTNEGGVIYIDQNLQFTGFSVSW